MIMVIIKRIDAPANSPEMPRFAPRVHPRSHCETRLGGDYARSSRAWLASLMFRCSILNTCLARAPAPIGTRRIIQRAHGAYTLNATFGNRTPAGGPDGARGHGGSLRALSAVQMLGYMGRVGSNGQIQSTGGFRYCHGLAVSTCFRQFASILPLLPTLPLLSILSILPTYSRVVNRANPTTRRVRSVPDHSPG